MLTKHQKTQIVTPVIPTQTAQFGNVTNKKKKLTIGHEAAQSSRSNFAKERDNELKDW